MRKAGILLHITSLPGKYGVGTLGKVAYDFVDFLAKSNLKLWQVLPLYPTGYGDSPYQANCSKALNFYLIDLDNLVELGILNKDFLASMPFKVSDRVDYNILFKYKTLCLKEAFNNFKNNDDFKEFVNNKEYHEYAIYMTLKEYFNYEPWYNWPKPYVNYSTEIEHIVLDKHYNTYLFYIFTQYVFLKQWLKLKEYANLKGIEIIGDIPLYLGYDSADLYMHKALFDLKPNGQMNKVAGCPPDAFSTDGQLWGNPLYNWKVMAKDNYSWWHNRIKNEFKLFDYLRIDHFRGLDRYYAIPYGDDAARNGKWQNGPKIALFKDILDYKIIAEDLGEIDDGVRKLMRQTKFPGMKVLEFAFDGNPLNEHKPSNYDINYVCYTGTHDNSPLRSYLESLNEDSKNTFLSDLNIELEKLNIKNDYDNIDDVIDKLIELAFASLAKICIIPWQDIMHLGEDARMNHPSTLSTKNWSYIAKNNDFKASVANKLAKLVNKYNR